MCSARDDEHRLSKPEGRSNPGPHGESVIPAGDAPCIWMGAGLISFRLCDREFRCESCPLDASLRPQGGEHRRSGARAPEPAADAATAGAPGFDSLVELHLPDPPGDRLYHAGHTWVRFETGGTVQIGIDAFATAVAGPPRGVVAPHPGTLLRHGRPCAWLDEPGGTLTVWAPLAGRLLELNPMLESHPGTAAEDPYGSGWILRLAPDDPAAGRRHLDDARAAAQRMHRDGAVWTQRVLRAVHRADPKIGLVLQDGGETVQTLDALLGPALRHALAAPFLDRGRTAR